MLCRICAIPNAKVIDAVELCLLNSRGKFFIGDFEELIIQFPAQKEALKKIDQQDCDIHYNFHQKMTRSASKAREENEGNSITKEIGKDEAEVLYELLSTQAATFNALSHQINQGITDRERDMSGLIINPATIQLYNEIGVSIRATVRELRELNTAVNGAKDPSSEGLKLLATALAGGKQAAANNGDMTTKDFD